MSVTEFTDDVTSADNSNDFERRLFRLIYHTILLLFGVPGNCLILRVYCTKTLKTSTHVLIMALAWADLFVCLIRVREISIQVIRLTGGEIPQVFTFIRSFETTAIGTSVMITAVIAADRYDCICRPHRRFFSHRRGRLAAWASFLFSFVINIPAFVAVFIHLSNHILGILVLAFQIVCFATALVMVILCYGHVYFTIRKHVQIGVVSTTSDEIGLKLDKRSTRLLPDTQHNDELNISVVDNVLSTFTSRPSSNCTTRIDRIHIKSNDASTSSHVTPDVSHHKTVEKCETLPNNLALQQGTLIGKDPREEIDGNRNPRQNPCHGKTNLQRKTTKMLFVASVVFLLTWLPYFTYAMVLLAYHSGAAINSEFSKIMLEISYTAYINNAINPLIYGIANRRFRKDCREVLRKIKLN